MEKITREEFIKGYCERAGHSREWFQAHGLDVYPCNCGEDVCEGWQMTFVEGVEERFKIYGHY